eukprot:COSAG02_NODE_2462_length_8788_cov_3.780297_3_plen_67_part_00
MIVQESSFRLDSHGTVVLGSRVDSEHKLFCTHQEFEVCTVSQNKRGPGASISLRSGETHSRYRGTY